MSDAEASVTLANIAVWDGKRVRALGSGVNGTVNALALNDRGDQLFVGGTFVSAGAGNPGRVAAGAVRVGLRAYA